MKATTLAAAALIGVVFAASTAYAQSSAPGTPHKPTQVTAVPPTPPPGGPDKYTTQTGPTRPGIRTPDGPSPVDDLAADPNTAQASTCHSALGGVKYLNCVASLIAICERRGGTLSGTSSSVSCSSN